MEDEEREQSKPISIRDLDDAFYYQDENNTDKVSRNNNSFSAAVILTIVYAVLSSIIFGLFFYRGLNATMGFGGYLLDLIVIGFITWASTNEKSADRSAQAFWGTILLLAGDITLKVLIIYPFIEKTWSNIS